MSLASAQAGAPLKAPYKDRTLPVDSRVSDLLKRMTLEEKLNQLRCDPNQWEKFIETTSYDETFDILRPLKSLDAAKRANEVQRRTMKSRLGIPIVIHDEALHGLIGHGTASFPQSIAMAATWDPDMVSLVSGAIDEEAGRARHVGVQLAEWHRMFGEPAAADRHSAKGVRVQGLDRFGLRRRGRDLPRPPQHRQRQGNCRCGA